MTPTEKKPSVEGAKSWIGFFIAVIALITAVFKPVITKAMADQSYITRVESLEKNKELINPVVWKTKDTAEKALDGVSDLKIQIADVRGAQETARKETAGATERFRIEYREDQKDNETKLRAMEDRIVRAVSKNS